MSTHWRPASVRQGSLRTKRHVRRSAMPRAVRQFVRVRRATFAERRVRRQTTLFAGDQHGVLQWSVWIWRVPPRLLQMSTRYQSHHHATRRALWPAAACSDNLASVIDARDDFQSVCGKSCLIIYWNRLVWQM